MSFWSQALEMARIDLKVERRTGDTATIVLPFALAALVVFPLAMGGRLALISSVGPGVLWALGVLFGMQIALRESAQDTPERRDLYALTGLDPAARFVGRTLSGASLTAGFLLVLMLGMVLLFSPELPPGWVMPTVAGAMLMAIGLTELGTLAGEITAGLRNRTTLASLIVAPLSLPLVIGASQTLEAVDRGTGILPWMLLLLATDIALAVAGVGLAGPLEEASR